MTFANNKKWLMIGVFLLIAAAVIVKKVVLPKNDSIIVAPKIIVAQNSIYGVGTVEAKEVVILAPKTTSKLQTLYADEGDLIKANQVLAKMEISELHGTLQESNAALAKSRSQLAASQAIIEDLEAKKSLADVTLTRYTTLLKGGFVTQAEFDTAQANARSANAQLKSAKENLTLSAHDIEKSEAALIAQNAKIDDLILRSPFDGIVISRDAEAGSTVGAGIPVFHIANPKTLWVKVYIDERQSGALSVGQRATVTLRSLSEKHFAGEVARIAVESDRITEERVVYIRLLNGPKLVHIGEQAEANITIPTKQDAHL
ncbi:MAG TPA: efflux RND transporter periplasmic adaptor subunit [Sulfuricurvum sp.]|nr:efflux RND transporter periplasmic adaptor subunit [Sulfuricurvum sp.]